jgi:glutathione S-transferase
MSIADIGVACAMRGIQQWDFRPGWKEKYPELAEWWEAVETRDSFQQTLPVLFEITEKIV